ncbi:Latrophilin/CL-1-like GPS domain protein [Cooperia oncophora]
MQIEVHRPEAYAGQTNEAVVPAKTGVVARTSWDDDTEVVPAADRPHAASPAMTPPAAPAQPTTVQFSGFSQSPIITLPSLDRTSQPSLDRSRLRLGYYVFTTFGQLLGQTPDVIVNSYVIGASVDDATRSLKLPDDEPATFTFYHLVKNGVSNPRCVYWDLDEKTWSTDGCRMISTNDDATPVCM